jgi:DnaJ-class molecular chaperone
MAINEHMKWPIDKREYDRNYLRAFGKICPECKGKGEIDRPCWDVSAPNDGRNHICPECNGLGYVEKEK